MLLKNIKIINYNSIIQNADIEIENGKIKKIIPKEGKPEFIAVPGFIDTHIHGYVGYDAMDGTEAIEKISLALAKEGTTSFFPTLMTASLEKILKRMNDATKAKSLGSKIVGIHLEGPFISIEKKGAHDQNYIVKATDEYLQELIDVSKGLLKKITIAPETVTKEQVKFLAKNGVMPSLGHTNTCGYVAKEYIEAGALSATHLWNAMSGVANRKPGLVEVAINSDKLYAELICDLIHVDEEAIHLTISAKTPEKIVAITDAIRPAGLDDGDFESGGLEITKKGKLITLKGTETIAGSGATMMENFKTLIMLGYNIKDVVAMTSKNAAKSLKLEKIGEIKEGFYADINLLNDKGQIEKVFINGKEF